MFQDRLVKEMRLRGIRDMDQANALLEQMFLADLNRRYSVKPANTQDLHRTLDPEIKLQEVLCVQEERVVGQDWCVRWRNRWLQIAAGHESLRLARRKVLVRELADGTLLVDYQGKRLSVREIRARPTPPKPRKVIVNNRSCKPVAEHPWRSKPPVGSLPPVKSAPATPARTSPAGNCKAG